MTTSDYMDDEYARPPFGLHEKWALGLMLGGCYLMGAGTMLLIGVITGAVG